MPIELDKQVTVKVQAKEIHLHMKVRDEFQGALVDQNGETLAVQMALHGASVAVAGCPGSQTVIDAAVHKILHTPTPPIESILKRVKETKYAD